MKTLVNFYFENENTEIGNTTIQKPTFFLYRLMPINIETITILHNNFTAYANRSFIQHKSKSYLRLGAELRLILIYLWVRFYFIVVANYYSKSCFYSLNIAHRQNFLQLWCLFIYFHPIYLIFLIPSEILPILFL